MALMDSADSSHRRALELTAGFGGHVVLFTTDEVLAEHLSFFSPAHRQIRRTAFRNAQLTLENRKVRVIPQSHDSFLSGMALYGARLDKGYSLTDCVSMAAMRREGLSDVLTNDKHFEQEGFRALFRP